MATLPVTDITTTNTTTLPIQTAQEQAVAPAIAPAAQNEAWTVQFGEPNCMHSVVLLIRSGEEAGTCMKVLTYVLVFFSTILVGATVIGLIPILMTCYEYLRVTNEELM